MENIEQDYEGLYWLVKAKYKFYRHWMRKHCPEEWEKIPKLDGLDINQVNKLSLIHTE